MGKCKKCGNEFPYNELIILSDDLKYCGKCHQKVFESKTTKCERCKKEEHTFKMFKVNDLNVCEHCIFKKEKRKRGEY